MTRYRWKRLEFSPTCPSGGMWYSCASGSRFVGCCVSDPCSNGCSQGNIRTPCSLTSLTHQAQCASGSKTFWGCCKSNPCNQGLQCPSGDLVPAFIDRPEQLSAYSPTGSLSSTSTSSLPSSTSYRSTTTTSTSSSTHSSAGSFIISSRTSSTVASPPTTVTVVAPSPGQNNRDGHIAAIAGGAAGGGLGIAVLLGLLIYLIFHAKKSRNLHKDILDRRQSDLTMRISEKPDVGGSPTAPVRPPCASPDPNMSPYDPNRFTYQQQALRQFELPAMPSSRGNLWGTYHPHRLSELSGETARRTDADSIIKPWPHAYSMPQSPQRAVGESPN
ncbi:uncharacterized protein BDR25DRAFT_313706 [Lindgomyces ingoldianus]|uniref:Uncharacterized protein n=1 Tax=Lindgomyces ingoldianus TaxID=673940 RepID=A0ACB6QXQ6_9PLEO|nr:uncharacterized protein BDR25DRAFT_313706 [Lindgomyces ingoldianus]KAF2471829.1 hypothetical protein BDR25DRAFT_313706 [Lindgomyces ingoldianus]